jgi:integrase
VFEEADAADAEFAPSRLGLSFASRETEAHDFDEAKRLVAAAEGEWRTMILVALRTGMRIGELMALRWQDVDLVGGRITVRRNVVWGHVGTPKSGKPREIPLSNDTLSALKSHRHLRGPLVFCDDGGHMLTEGEVRHPLWRACKRAGLRQILGTSAATRSPRTS